MNAVKRSFNIVWLIFKHEFNLYFFSPYVYLIGAVWLFFAGVFFWFSLNGFNQGAEPSMAAMQQSMVFLMIFVAPALTMRLISDELRAGTHELLFTSPLKDWEIVVGKWLAVWAVYTVYVLITLPMPIILLTRGNPDPGLIASGYLGMWLIGGATLAIGVFGSSITQHQAVAFMVTMGILVAMWISGNISGLFNSQFVAEVLDQVSLVTHYGSLVNRALINPVDIAFFIGIIAIFLFLATQSLSTRRWSAS